LQTVVASGRRKWRGQLTSVDAKWWWLFWHNRAGWGCRRTRKKKNLWLALLMAFPQCRVHANWRGAVVPRRGQAGERARRIQFDRCWCARGVIDVRILRKQIPLASDRALRTIRIPRSTPGPYFLRSARFQITVIVRASGMVPFHRRRDIGSRNRYADRGGLASLGGRF
jgi:hypothetical protein